MGRQILGGHGSVSGRAGGVTMPGHGKASKSGRGRVAVPARIAAAIPNAERKRDCFIAGIDWRTGRGLVTTLKDGRAIVYCCRCGHEWIPRIKIIKGVARTPRKCPACTSKEWNAPRKYETTEGNAARLDAFLAEAFAQSWQGILETPQEIENMKAERARAWDEWARAETERRETFFHEGAFLS